MTVDEKALILFEEGCFSSFLADVWTNFVQFERPYLNYTEKSEFVQIVKITDL